MKYAMEREKPKRWTTAVLPPETVGWYWVMGELDKPDHKTSRAFAAHWHPTYGWRYRQKPVNAWFWGVPEERIYPQGLIDPFM